MIYDLFLFRVCVLVGLPQGLLTASAFDAQRDERAVCGALLRWGLRPSLLSNTQRGNLDQDLTEPCVMKSNYGRTVTLEQIS